MKLKKIILCSIQVVFTAAFTSVFTCHVNAMDAGVLHVPLEAPFASISKWPLYVYSEAFPGAMGNPFEARESVDFLIKEALAMTKEEADRVGLAEAERVKLDWAYALHQVEKELLRKPFEVFTIEDISLISSWIARTTAANPGAFRSKRVQWRLKSEFTQQEKERLAKLEALNPNDIGAEDHAFIRTCYLSFAEADTIKSHLQNYQKTVKTLMGRRNEVQAGIDTVYFHLAIGLFANTSMVSIHPYEEASKRLGRLLMHIYLAQQGIEPITFYSGHLYVDKLIESLTQKNKNAFRDYVRESLVISAQLRRNPHYVTIVNDVHGKGCPAEMIHSALLSHPLHKAFLAQQQADKQPKIASSPAKKEITINKNCCAACHKTPADAGVALKLCSACKATSYCSAACQKAHWSTHKLACQKTQKK
jgi:hypothetical protein